MLGLLLIAVNLVAEEPQYRLKGLQLLQQQSSTILDIKQLYMAPDIQINDIRYRCHHTVDVYPFHHCQQADLRFHLQQNQLQLSGRVDYDVLNNVLKVNAVDQDKTMVFNYDSARQRQRIELTDWPIKKWLPPLLTSIKDNLSAQANGVVAVDLDDGAVKSLEGIQFSGLDYEHSDDLIALGLSGRIDFDWLSRQQTVSARVRINQGEALLKQVYVNFSEFPLVLDLKVDSRDSDYVIQWQLDNETAFEATGEMILSEDFNMGDWQGRLEITDSTLFNKHITNSVLEIYGFNKNQAAGGFEVNASGHGPRVAHMTADFKDFSFTNQKRKLAIAGLNGKVDWQWHQTSQPSSLSWHSLVLSGLPIQAADLRFNISEDDLSLYGRHVLPIFDGALVIQRLTVDGFMAEEPAAVKMDAEIEPISLLPISQALNWPQLAGQISGQLPGMVKSGHVIAFDGTLHLSVFDGSIRFQNLSMERLFGVAPVIAADVDINLLDLALLTQTYDFGLITGRLSGFIDHLRITNWKVDRMDATVYSVKTENSDQTISQKAIENISAIGGIKGAISRTFLRFFEEFKYKKIKLSCKLHNSVCQIGGIDNQDGRFTIVEGGGLPKINIVGYARQIAWDVFISRLLNASYDS
ncbi:hypothetical protein GCM10011365_10760 [Marinicella pacifica]|uniref:Dicarboxylate transport n=1 Tax=Marinicella pacifica TaxID=1171543 RepID=A0A917CNK7_9GAMM|nr:hypothetical protein [Marinicella pacifica]GGF91379.1 hypothetical protein GCM10011365_10760 [Marinicella pacifica]